jgi:hypothetical protein
LFYDLTKGVIIMRNACLRILILCAALLTSLLAVSCSSTMSPVNTGSDGIAIKGYDPVAYFTMGKSVKGSEQFVHEWQGARWMLANSEHLALFSAQPEKYAPQYGGY